VWHQVVHVGFLSDDDSERDQDGNHHTDEEDPEKSVEELIEFGLLASILVEMITEHDTDDPRPDSRGWSVVKLEKPNTDLVMDVDVSKKKEDEQNFN
jgi:hypothetical protein